MNLWTPSYQAMGSVLIILDYQRVTLHWAGGNREGLRRSRTDGLHPRTEPCLSTPLAGVGDSLYVLRGTALAGGGRAGMSSVTRSVFVIINTRLGCESDGPQQRSRWSAGAGVDVGCALLPPDSTSTIFPSLSKKKVHLQALRPQTEREDAGGTCRKEKGREEGGRGPLPPLPC